MATIETKWIDVGSFNFGTQAYGFLNFVTGTCSDTQNGTSNTSIDGLYTGGAISSLYWLSSSSLVLGLSTSAANSGWATMNVGGIDYNRADATYTGGSGGGSSWQWFNVPNPFGTTLGADKQVLWDDGAASIVAPVISSLSANTAASASSINVEVKLSSNGSGGTLEFARATTNSVPATGWQSSANFTQSRSSNFYYFASQDQDTSGAFDGGELLALGFIAPDTTVAASSFTITAAATSATVSVSSVTIGESYAVRAVNGGTNFASTTAASTSITIGPFTNNLPTEGNSTTYEIFANRPNSLGGSGLWEDTNDQFTVTRAVAALAAPTEIKFGSDPGTSASTVNITVTASGGAATRQVSDDNSTWLTNGSTIPFRRGIANTVYARSISGTQTSSVISSSLTLAYIAPDTSITPSISLTSISATFSGTVTASYTGGTSGHIYRILTTDTNTGLASGASVGTSTANGSGTGSIAITGTELPDVQGNVAGYKWQAQRPNSLGGDGLYDDTGNTFTITRTDATPNAFSFTDVTAASKSSIVNTYVQISGITQSVTASRTAGTANFAVSSSTATPTSGFSSTAKTITNNQYLHAQELSSDTGGVTKSSTFSVGGVSDNWNVTTTTASYDFLVSVLYESSGEGEIISFGVSGPTGGRSGQTSGTAIYINAGDVVAFKHSSQPSIVTMDVLGFNRFTNTSGILDIPNDTISAGRTWCSGVAAGTVDSISMYIGGVSETVYFAQAYETPDTTVSFNEEISVSANATGHTQTITEVSPNTSSASTTYLIGSASVILASRTGPGSVSLSSVPPFLGVPVEYTIYAALPLAAGGNSARYLVGTYEVTRGSAPGSNPPGIDPYGIAIYDHTGTFVTSFTENSTIFRKVYEGSTTTSTSGVTNVNTGLTGLSSTNAVALLTSPNTGAGTEGLKNIATTFVSGSVLRIARDTAATALDVTILQYKGTTLNAPAKTYGIELYNEAGDLVVDEFASFYAVKELINCATANSNITAYNYTGYSRILVQLTENDYPFTGGLPVPALQGPGLALLSPPEVLTYVTYTSSYRYVAFWVKAGQLGGGSSWNVAMLTERDNSSPSYYGGTASTYGVQTKDSSGNVLWDSSWRQAIINNIIPANQFTSGSSGQFTYDVTTGADGVTPPYAVAYSPPGVVDVNFGTLDSNGEGKTISNLNLMDPTNTFLLGGGMLTGAIYYYTGLVSDPELGISYQDGGGRHIPGVVITSESSVNITMFRLGDGPISASAGEYCTRVATSHHPEGAFVLARIT